MPSAIILVVLILTTHLGETYFNFDNCPSSCQEKSMWQCLIHNAGDGTYDYECFVNWSDCVDLNNEMNACIAQDKPTKGGSGFWDEYKRSLPPKPTPIPKEKVSSFWMISSLAQSCLTTITICMFIGIKIMKKRRQRNYERITETLPESPEHPYRENTVETIPEV